MADEQGDAQGVPAVVAYRLTLLERDLSQVDRKLDSFINQYPSKELLDMMLDPLKKSVDGMYQTFQRDQDKRRQEKEEIDKRKVQEQFQLKMLIYAAVLSPLFSAIIAIIIGVISNGKS